VRGAAGLYGRAAAGAALRKDAAWWGTPVEAHAAIVRLRRDTRLDDDGRTRADDRLRLLRRRWSEIVPSDDVRPFAEVALDRYELRAADALQIGAALVWCSGNLAAGSSCFDQRLARAAALEGFDVRPPGP